jgi:hypothetical protein
MAEVINAAKIFETMDEMLAASDVEYAVIDGWSGSIRIGSLTAGDMIEWSEANEGEAKRTAGLRLIVKSIVNSKGERIGNDKHIAMLRNKSHKVTEKIVREILRLNGMNTKVDEPKKD